MKSETVLMPEHCKL